MKGQSIAVYRSFYNPDRKEEFLQSAYRKTRGSVVRPSAMEIKAKEFFNDMYKHEAAAGKDIAEMEEDEVLRIMRAKQLNSGTMSIRARVLGSYLAWSEKRYGTNNMFDGMSSADIIDRIGVAESAWCPLRKIEEYTHHIKDADTRIWVRGIMLAAYYGVYNGWVENLNHLNCKDIVGDKIKTYDGRLIPADNRLVESMIECSKISAISESLGNYKIPVYTFTYPYQDYATVFKGVSRSGSSKKATDVRRFKYYINALNALVDCDVSLVNIRDTGIVIRLYEHAKARGNDLLKDMESAEQLTDDGYNKAWLYNGYLHEIGCDLSWSAFIQYYAGWHHLLRKEIL